MAVKSKRGPKHKTKMDRECTLMEVARLERMRLNQYEIAARLGFTQAQISIYQKQLRERYAATQLGSTAEMVAEKIAQYDDVIRELSVAWEKSKVGVHAITGNEIDRPGEAVFLGKAMDALKAQRELLGLDMPTKVDSRNAVVNVTATVTGLPRTEAGGVDWAALSGRPTRSDPMDEFADEPVVVTKSLPAHNPGKNGKGK